MDILAPGCASSMTCGAGVRIAPAGFSLEAWWSSARSVHQNGFYILLRVGSGGGASNAPQPLEWFRPMMEACSYQMANQWLPICSHWSGSDPTCLSMGVMAPHCLSICGESLPPNVSVCFIVSLAFKSRRCCRLQLCQNRAAHCFRWHSVVA